MRRAGVRRRKRPKPRQWRWAGVWAEEITRRTDRQCLPGTARNLSDIYAAICLPIKPICLPKRRITGLPTEPERTVQDMFGIRFEDHPDPKRWTRHQAWDEKAYPLRRDFPAAGHVKSAKRRRITVIRF